MKFLFLALFFSQVVVAQTAIEIASIDGKVLYYRDRVISILTEKTILKNDDLIMTKAGRVSLQFEDTTLDFAPHSLFRVMNLKNKERHQFGEFLMGDFSSSTRKKLVDTRRLEVLLPKSKVHVIGTKYVVQIAANVEKLLTRQKGEFEELPRLELIPEVVASNDLVTQITCLEGKVFVKTDSGQEKTLEKSESVLYSGNGANLRLTLKDESDLESLREGLKFFLDVSPETNANPAE
ncbi:MAG: hypothetical protein CME71_00100 [Halobacteriovorax sp.]|nr:hypothetical protein [Halobacteriovorax sp.]|tara:strand:+ start:156 stop:863 length:708 start_codon:yes stop_codon:yes gene_type:complete